MATTDDRRRAQRFPLHLPLKVKWQEESSDVAEPAALRDISASGVYFMVHHELKPESKVEFYVRLKTEGGSNGGVLLHCVGSVVRVDSKDKEQVGVAARIDRYRFLRPGELSPDLAVEEMAQ